LSLGSIASTAAAGAIGSAVSGQAAKVIPGEVGQGVAQVIGSIAGGAVGNGIANRARTRARGQQNIIDGERQALLQDADSAVTTYRTRGRGQRLGGNNGISNLTNE